MHRHTAATPSRPPTWTRSTPPSPLRTTPTSRRSTPADDRLSPTEYTRPDHEEMRERCPLLRIGPGRRKTRSVEMLVIEAELAAEGKEFANPATPISERVGEAFAERIEDTDLVPAWTRPWEVEDDA